VVLLSDWTFEDPYRVLAKLKKQPDSYNFQKRTVFDFFSDVRRRGLLTTVRDRAMWSSMRMNPTDILDVTGATYTYLLNGLGPDASWTGLFRKGERVLLHVINAAADTYFDLRVPGLPLTVVQSNGQYVHPVETDELRVAIAETYDVIVEPPEDRPYAVFAETMDRSGYAAGALAPRPGLKAPLPARRRRPVLTMADMGMDHDTGGHGAAPAGPARGHDPAPEHAGHAPQQDARAPHARRGAHGETDDGVRDAVAGRIRTTGLRPPGTIAAPVEHERSTHGAGNAAVPTTVRSRLSEPGIGLGEDGWRVLLYTDLRALARRPDARPPTREIEMHLTGNMERFMWSIDGVPFADSEPIRAQEGERLRLTMVNDTMMNHPMHLHGMWMELENGHGALIPRVHTINVKPAERLSLLVTADAPGRWAFHCHVLYHMEVGMFRVLEVAPAGPAPPVSDGHGR
jgi:CopA family copper-resistance protein